MYAKIRPVLNTMTEMRTELLCPSCGVGLSETFEAPRLCRECAKAVLDDLYAILECSTSAGEETILVPASEVLN